MWKTRVYALFEGALCVLLCITVPLQSYAKTIREIQSDENKVVGINTAIGFSTILEFQSKPISAVLGDQDAFKLEFVGNSITVKPLIARAQSNLFVFTEFDRFNCTLRAGSAAEVDYIVKIRAPHSASPGESGISSAPLATLQPQAPRSRPVHRMAAWNGYVLQVIGIAEANGSDSSRAATILEFELSSKRQAYSFSPQALGAKQGGKFLGVESIYLDSLNLKPGAAPIHGKIVLLNQDFQAGNAFSLIFAVPGKKSQSSHRIEVSLSGKHGKPKHEKGK